MDSRRDLFEVLLLPECNVYERYPELVQRVDYFLYEWTEEMLARTEALLRKQARSLRNTSEAFRERCYSNNGDDEAFTHARSINIAWRQFAVSRLQLPRYPPERINWNKDADPVFLYGQMPALRLEVPWSAHSMCVKPSTCSGPDAEERLKPALKRTDLQTFLTSPTLSPVSSPTYSPLHSPAMSIRENMSTSSFGSDATLDTTDGCREIKPRLRFNDQVEQCMVVFDQEKEYLPTDWEDSADEDNMFYRRSSRNSTTAASGGKALQRVSQKQQKQKQQQKQQQQRQKPGKRGRRSLVIKLAPTYLKGDHRKIVSVSTVDAGYGGHFDSDFDDYEEDPFGDYSDLSLFGNSLRVSERTVDRHTGQDSERRQNSSSSGIGGVSGYVQGCVQSVAGQVRKLVNGAVSSASTTSASAGKSSSSSSTALSDKKRSTAAGVSSQPSDYVVADPFASSASSINTQDHQHRRHSQEAARCSSVAVSSSDVVRDPFFSSSSSSSSQMSKQSAAADHVPFDDDEDAIIQEFEREMQKYSSNRVWTQHSKKSLNQQPLQKQPQKSLLYEHHPPTKRHDSVMDGDSCHRNSPEDYEDDDGWGASEFGLCANEYRFRNHSHEEGFNDDDDEIDFYANDYGFNTDSMATRATSSMRPSPSSFVSSAKLESAAFVGQQQQQLRLQQRVRNDSIIDRAEDTIVNTVDAVKWCASFISNYTIF
ncbi:hypothetical protein LPJ64_000312 [Coemansia asiatica]|uniref:Uncharacterized protein n=1 Tax=Coemansia asiatica TaxID=1052880 RepID=A0A9W7XS40_9FUNG|nr:hypothetical protein LPJ64_000312 [Coemansia asiatica]